MYRYSLLLGLCVTLVVGAVVPSGLSGAGTDSAMLKKIASRLDDRTGVISIEATDPVPYVASQPDPRTLVVELRDIEARGFADQFKADPRQPFAAVQVESAHTSDGVHVARVRITMSQPQRPKVRSARNIIYVEADRTDTAPAAASAAAPAAARPAAPTAASNTPARIGAPSSAIRDVRVTRRGDATAVTLLGTSRLVATSVREANQGGQRDGQRRVIIDLPNVTSAVPSVTTLALGPVQRVRVGPDPGSPLMMQVSVELWRAATYRVESSPDGNDLTLVFDERATDPVAATRSGAGPVSDRAVPMAPVLFDRASPNALQQAPAPQAAPAAAQTLPVPQLPGAPQAPSPAPPAAVAQAAPRFTGHAVTLDFQGADLRAVLRSFSEISGLNIVLDPTIQGSVDVALRDVPWDQAFDIILRANKLGYVTDGTIIRVAPLVALADEEAQRQKLAEAQAEAGELRVLTRSLSYARAEELEPLLRGTSLSRRGTIQIDRRTNTIIISDLADRLTKANDLLTTLDRPEPQVEIEARIVQTTREFARSIGVQWGVNGRASTALGNTLPLSFPNQGSITGRTGVSQGAPPPDSGADSVSNMVNLGVAAATSGVGLALGSINGALNLDVALSALESTGQGRILSTPRVSTQNNIEAEIMQGIQIPIQTVANNTVTVTFRDASLILRVTPQITAANTVIMKIMVENSAPDFSRAVNLIPPIDTQRATTQVLVGTGETTVIGGIYVSREQTSQDRTPGLHRIPLLGWLFKRNDFSDETRELLIFITPKIIRL
jgi:type IV pilus assembly protein PilQ